MLWRLKRMHRYRRTRTKAWEPRMNDRLQPGRADLNSERRFKRPMDVVEAAGISIEAKFSILEAWEADEKALHRAADEGLGSGEPAHLQTVLEALSQLKAMELAHGAEGV